MDNMILKMTIYFKGLLCLFGTEFLYDFVAKWRQKSVKVAKIRGGIAF